MTRVEQYQGYQVKTRSLSSGTSESDLVEDAASGTMLVKGVQIFTVHHSPYTLKFFENVPFEELQETLAERPLRARGDGRDRQPLAALHLPPRGRRRSGSRSTTATASP